MLATAEPFLDHLVAADGVVLDAQGDYQKIETLDSQIRRGQVAD